jgi:hypothetical protein
MQHSSNDPHPATPKVPWNKGKIIGARPPLQPKHVWSIRTKLQMDGRQRDLAMFNLTIDSKLRGCDVVRVKVEDVAPRGLTASQKYVYPLVSRWSVSDRARENGGKLGNAGFKWEAAAHPVLASTSLSDCSGRGTCATICPPFHISMR